MKAKKILVIFFLMFLLTGCTIDYELEITNELVNENITIIDYNEEKWDVFDSYGSFSMDDTTYRDIINTYMNGENNIYVTSDNSNKYDKELINEGGLGIKLKSNYDIEEFNAHTYIGSCYKYFNVKNDGEVYTLSTSKIFMCFNDSNPLLDQVNVKIRVNNEVIDSNADSYSDNVYTWNIDKENASNKPIIISYKRDKTLTETIEDLLFSDDKISLIIIFGIFVAIAVVIIYAYTKNKKNNQI